MSNGDDDAADADADAEADANADADAGEGGTEGDGEMVAAAEPGELNERLDEIEASLEAAETESDLDDVESDLDAVAEDVETLPEPDEDADADDDEDVEDPKADLEARIEDIRGDVEEQRGPYAEDVVEQLEDAQSTITDSEWTDQGERGVADAVSSFLDDANEVLGTDHSAATAAGADVNADSNEDSDPNPNPDSNADADPDTDPGSSVDLEALAGAVGTVAEDVESADLDPDEDADAIAELLEAADALTAGLDDAQTWDDLTVREQLDYQGFYDVLTSKNRKDFPPELNVVRIAENQKDPEPILLALEYLTSEFMQENCMTALKRLGAPEAFDEMHERAQKRRELPIQVLGKIGDDRALETLHEFIEGDSNPNLQRVVLKTVGEIGSEESTQHVADRLVAEEDEVRSAAARALGRIGDPRAIDPLADLLADDESDSVRASVAWALVQIGTEDALEAAAEYSEDRSYIVQVEADKAARALDGDEAEATA